MFVDGAAQVAACSGCLPAAAAATELRARVAGGEARRPGRGAGPQPLAARLSHRDPDRHCRAVVFPEPGSVHGQESNN